MDILTVPRKDAAIGHTDGSQSTLKLAESEAEERLGRLIRDGDRRLSTLDPGRELRRRACPSGE